jgi:hypothetical protein
MSDINPNENLSKNILLEIIEAYRTTPTGKNDEKLANLENQIRGLMDDEANDLLRILRIPGTNAPKREGSETTQNPERK